MKERAYFSTPRTTALLSEGKPLLFYESGKAGGQASIIAAARVVRTGLTKKIDIGPNIKRRGVLESGELARVISSPNVSVTTFDNIMLLTRPVAFRRLREIGCVDGTNLVTSKEITASHLARILREGM